LCVRRQRRSLAEAASSVTYSHVYVVLKVKTLLLAVSVQAPSVIVVNAVKSVKAFSVVTARVVATTAAVVVVAFEAAAVAVVVTEAVVHVVVMEGLAL